MVDLFGPVLTDPLTCGQDHAYNLLKATELAPKLCSGCEDYHATISLNRIVGASAWSGASRVNLAAFLSGLLAKGIPSGSYFDVVIAGAADTSTLAASANAIAAAGPHYLALTRFHILDRCQTPLTLCEEFAHRHGLVVRTVTDDLLNPQNTYSGDVVIMHSVLNFLPDDAHESILATAMEWLKPSGLIYLWNALKRVTAPEEAAFRRENSERIRLMLADGRLSVGEDITKFLERLERFAVKNGGGPQGHLTASYFQDLIARTGGSVASFRTEDDVLALPSGGEMRRPFLEAIFGRH